MKINRENYGSVMLDFMEGKLSEIEQDKVLDFLMLNPDLMDEIKDLNLVTLEPENISFHPKHKLIKEFPDRNSKPDGSNFDMFAIAYFENDLDSDQRLDFEKFLSESKDHQKEFELWSKTRLIGEKISFPIKKELKKSVVRSFRPVWILIPTAVAASLTVMFLIFSNPGIPEFIAELEETEIIPDQKVQIAEIEAAEFKRSKNPLIISEKEKPIHQKLSGKTDGKNGESVNQKSINQFSKEDPSSASVHKVANKQNILFSNGDFGANIVAEFQPEPDKIRSLNLPPTQIYYSNIIEAGIAKMDIGKTMEEFTKEDVTIWNIANHGIEGVNKLVGSDMKLLADRNDNGEVSRFEFTSRILKISAPIQHQKSHNDN